MGARLEPGYPEGRFDSDWYHQVAPQRSGRLLEATVIDYRSYTDDNGLKGGLISVYQGSKGPDPLPWATPRAMPRRRKIALCPNSHDFSIPLWANNSIELLCDLLVNATPLEEVEPCAESRPAGRLPPLAPSKMPPMFVRALTAARGLKTDIIWRCEATERSIQQLAQHVSDRLSVSLVRASADLLHRVRRWKA